MRNSLLASQGVFGPVVPPRQLKAGERVLFQVEPQPVYGPDGGSVPGCARVGAFHATGPSGLSVMGQRRLRGANMRRGCMSQGPWAVPGVAHLLGVSQVWVRVRIQAERGLAPERRTLPYLRVGRLLRFDLKQIEQLARQGHLGSGR